MFIYVERIRRATHNGAIINESNLSCRLMAAATTITMAIVLVALITNDKTVTTATNTVAINTFGSVFIKTLINKTSTTGSL